VVEPEYGEFGGKAVESPPARRLVGERAREVGRDGQLEDAVALREEPVPVVVSDALRL
jgi:hypothetical protein